MIDGTNGARAPDKTGSLTESEIPLAGINDPEDL
jgi:hypothetical protein